MQIEQIDRDAAARVHERSCYEIVRIQGAQCRNGYGDSDPLVRDFARHRLAALSARPADNVVKALQQALVNHNDVLRSAYQIAARQGNSTDWDGFTKRAGSVLHFHHDEVNAARAAIAAITGESAV
ncbi:MAG: hypothetical protein A2792_09920 [Sphingomonadales bacterium RIFCSPHIGHO2_01_FULL_65_20]|nr:MAG: hypothetical protein A2792_09920 [Sphingomonadales bacterium RIFCSPHIGHO2_01_FULL_65_20]